MKQTRPSQREAILTAAARVLLRDGLLALTLDAVAEEADVSKGGLLYHFASKEALVRGMIDHSLGQVDEDVRRCREADPNPRGRWLRAYLTASFPEGESATAPEERPPSQTRSLFAALLAALALSPELADVVRKYAEGWAARLAEDDLDPLEHWITSFAADGLWFWELLGVFPVDEALRARIIGRLKERTRGPSRHSSRKRPPRE